MVGRSDGVLARRADHALRHAFAWAASLGVHALVLAALAPHLRLAPPRHARAPLAVSLLPAPAAPEARQPAAVPSRGGTPAAHRPAPAVDPGPPGGPEEPGALEAAGLARSAGTPGGKDLAARWRPGTAGGEAPGPEAGDPENPASRVRRVIDEVAGRVRAGSSFEGHFAPFASRLREDFHPRWNVLDHGPKRGAAGSIPLLRVLPGYLDMAGRYGRAAPLTEAEGVLGERRSEAGKVVERLVVAGGPHGSYERGQNPFEIELRVLVEIVHATDGAIDRVAVRESSGNGALDRAALGTARAALERSGWRPPPGACHTSVWAFVTRFGVVPPTLAVSCPPSVLWTGELEQCDYPLKKYTSSRVELHALE